MKRTIDQVEQEGPQVGCCKRHKLKENQVDWCHRYTVEELSREKAIDLFKKACIQGLPNQFRALLKDFKFTKDELEQARIFWSTAYAGQAAILEMLFNRFEVPDAVPYAFRLAIEEGKLAVAQMMQQRFNVISTSADLKQHLKWAVVARGDVSVVYWLLQLLNKENALELNKEDALDAFSVTLWRGHLNVAQLLSERFAFTLQDVTEGKKKGWFAETMFSKDLVMAKWFAEHFKITRENAMAKDNAAFAAAMTMQDMEKSKWLVDQFHISAKEIEKDFTGKYSDDYSKDKMRPWLAKVFTV